METKNTESEFLVVEHEAKSLLEYMADYDIHVSRRSDGSCTASREPSEGVYEDSYMECNAPNPEEAVRQLLCDHLGVAANAIKD